MKKHVPAILVAVSFIFYFLYFSSRYTLACPPGHSACLNASFFLIDKWDTEIEQGDLAYFEMNVENQFYPTGLRWIKKVAALPNSVVSVEENKVVVDNLTEFPLSLSHIITALNLADNSIGEIEDYTKVIQLENDEVFMIGETINSFDGRFWGPLKKEQIKGTAYAIF